jgi:uncharacterized iron-regulated protein
VGEGKNELDADFWCFCCQDLFRSVVQTQTHELAALHEHTETVILSEQSETRLQMTNVIALGEQHNHDEHEITRTAIVQVKETLVKLLKEEMAKTDEELRKTLQEFTNATNPKEQCRLQERGQAVSGAWLALKDMNRNLQVRVSPPPPLLRNQD